MPPYRPRPGRIANNPRDNMQVKLAHDIAKRADIDLVGPQVTLQEPRSATCLVHQLRLIRELKIDQFDHAFQPWHENEPWPAGVVHQHGATQRQVADDKRVAREPIVQLETHEAHARPWAPRGRLSLTAIVSATSAKLARAPIGPGRAPAPKARIGTCSRVWSKPRNVGSLP